MSHFQATDSEGGTGNQLFRFVAGERLSWCLGLERNLPEAIDANDLKGSTSLPQEYFNSIGRFSFIDHVEPGKATIGAAEESRRDREAIRTRNGLSFCRAVIEGRPGRLETSGSTNSMLRPNVVV